MNTSMCKFIDYQKCINKSVKSVLMSSMNDSHLSGVLDIQGGLFSSIIGLCNDPSQLA